MYCEKEKTKTNSAGKTTLQIISALLLASVLFTLHSSQAALPMKQYVVQKGDSIDNIADFYGITRKDLIAANKMKKGQSVWAGETLRIPAVLSYLPNRIHVVKSGDSLESISKTYDVSIRALTMANPMCEYNDLTVGQEMIIPLEDKYANPVYKPEVLKTRVTSGRAVAEGVVHTVQPGQGINALAAAYQVFPQEIIQANNLNPDSTLSVHQQIFIPAADTVPAIEANVHAFTPVHFARLRDNRQVTLQLLTENGSVDPVSRRMLSALASPDGVTVPPVLLDPELIQLIQQVADQFPGRTIEVISGYRPKSKAKSRESNHNNGRALDFRISGVGRKKVYRFVKKFDNVGAGFYPNAKFIHLDVREYKTLWTDLSGVGEPAQYAKMVTFYNNAS